MTSKYDVFLNFRKEDTGRTFVSHLLRSLDQKGIRTYRAENQQTGDRRISSEVTQAIGRSTIAVVMISENYASSVWCLDVLAEIIMKRHFLTMITVFYEVDPGDLDQPTGQFTEDFRRHEERTNPATVNRWRNSLRRLESADPKFCSRNWEDDSKMLDDIIVTIASVKSRSDSFGKNFPQRRRRHRVLVPAESSGLAMRLESDIYTKHISLSGSAEAELERDAPQLTALTDESLSVASDDDSNGLVGMYRHKAAVYALLDLESKNIVRTVGIWGEVGVGKTTLAERVFDDISSRFQHHCFLRNVNDIYQNRISPSLLEHLTNKKSSDNMFDDIIPFLVNRHVLLVIDGVHDTRHEQLKNAMKVSHWLGPGSRVIMTFRFNPPDSCGIKYTYQMESMRYEEAIQLFSLCAFKTPYPLVGFEGLSIRAVHFAGRLPLALKVLGSFLYDKDLDSWKTTLRNLEASQDDGSCQVSNYIGAREYLPRRQTELEHYIRADEDSASYHMLL